MELVEMTKKFINSISKWYRYILQAGSYQVVHMVQCTTKNSSYYREVVQCTTKNFDATVKKWCKKQTLS